MVGMVPEVCAAMGVSQEEQLEMALNIASSITKCACWIWGPGHLEGHPEVDLPPTVAEAMATACPEKFVSPNRCCVKVRPHVGAIHSFAHVVVRWSEHSLRYFDECGISVPPSELCQRAVP